uniref:MYB binding protein (P160) 1a n=1 Tax=Scleropages formosus TaxID=113540 RepID=A0A8C9WAX1_SCLFO
MAAAAAAASMGEIDGEAVRPRVSDAKGILRQSREFLDFFWDIAKPEQETRLKAIERLTEHLKTSEKKNEQSDELKYTLKRLVDGLSHSREAARPGFSLALAQVRARSLTRTLTHTHTRTFPLARSKLVRNAAFGRFFGVLALSQSTRLHKEPQVLVQCVQLLQSLAQYREHLRDLPRKTMVDILSETNEEVFQEVLLGALHSDLSCAFSTPEQLQLLLVAMQRFPDVLKPKKLKKLLGTATVITEENIPKLVEVLKMAARSAKKEHVLPAVALDLLQVSLREDRFELFWREAVVGGLLTDQAGPSSYMCYRLLASALPLLPLPQLRRMLSGEVMRHYGQHVVSAQLPDRFKFAPEMETRVAEFLTGCSDAEKQLAVMVAFSTLTNQGYPVVPSFWKVVQNLRPAVLRRYVDWLKDTFCRPQLDSCLDFSTRRQRENQEEGVQDKQCVFRLRKWIVPRLVSIVENSQVKKDEELVMDIARFVFFHAFFDVKKSTPDIPETESTLSAPLDTSTRDVVASSFFGLLQHLNHLGALGDCTEGIAPHERRVQGVTADGSLWIYCLVQYADRLLKHTKYVCCARPMTPDERAAWDSMLASVEALRKRAKAKKMHVGEASAFQQLLLLMGIYLFKAPEESVELLQDLQNCMAKAQEKKARKKKTKADEEPHWVEVLVEILLSLLSQPSRLIRQVCNAVFSRIAAHLTPAALHSILDVLDPRKEGEGQDALVVTDERDTDKRRKCSSEDEEDEEEGKGEVERVPQNEDSDSSEEYSDDESVGDDEEEEEEQDVDQNFRLELMKVLQGQNALAAKEDGSEDEELDDEAMMKLDGSIATLFAEQKKRIQAKKDEKERLRKEKMLVRDFKIKVCCASAEAMREGACTSMYLIVPPPVSLYLVLQCASISVTLPAPRQHYTSLYLAVSSYLITSRCFSLYLVYPAVPRRLQVLDLLEIFLSKQSESPQVLGVVEPLLAVMENCDTLSLQAGAMGAVDVDRVTALYRGALTSFMTHRKSSLSGGMFTELFTRFPVLCVRLLDTAAEFISGGVRQYQQGEACTVVLRGLQTRDVQQLLPDPRWKDLCEKTLGYLVEVSTPTKPKGEKKEKSKKDTELQPPQGLRKKKGFLPETKKRKNRKKPVVQEGKSPAGGRPGSGATPRTPAGAAAQDEQHEKKRSKSSKKKRKQQGGAQGAGATPAKKAKAESAELQQQQKKKKKKKREGKGK